MLKQGIVALFALCCASFLSGVQAADLRIETEGGLAKGAEIIHVTTLADTGSGSLRAALLAPGPRIIVFDVAGYIDLTRDLDLNAGNVTIAGETAPSGGVVIRGGGLTIRASDVLIEHIAIYPGSNPDPKIAETRDAITIYGSKSRRNILRNIVLRNISAGWGVDENVGVQGLVDGLRIERSLIAEGLLKGGHPKGRHSMNVLLAQSVTQAFMARNIFAAGDQRNPRLTNGNSAAVVNNFIVAFGAAATHIDSSTQDTGPAAIDIIGNAYRPAKLSNCRNAFVLIAKDFFADSPGSRIFLNDNSEVANPERSCADQHAQHMPHQAASLAARANFDLSWYKITALGEPVSGDPR